MPRCTTSRWWRSPLLWRGGECPRCLAAAQALVAAARGAECSGKNQPRPPAPAPLLPRGCAEEISCGDKGQIIESHTTKLFSPNQAPPPTSLARAAAYSCIDTPPQGTWIQVASRVSVSCARVRQVREPADGSVRKSRAGCSRIM